MGKLNRIRTIAIALFISVAVAAPLALAQSTEEPGAGQKRHGQWRGHGGRGRFGGAFSRGLDLTDAQKAQMKQIREGHRESLRPLMEQIRAKRLEIREASRDGAFNEALVTQKLVEIAPLQAKMMGERARLHQELSAVLTAEQKAKLEQMREQRKARFAERRANKRQTR